MTNLILLLLSLFITIFEIYDYFKFTFNDIIVTFTCNWQIDKCFSNVTLSYIWSSHHLKIILIVNINFLIRNSCHLDQVIVCFDSTTFHNEMVCVSYSYDTLSCCNNNCHL